jgi:hypothetical protein
MPLTFGRHLNPSAMSSCQKVVPPAAHKKLIFVTHLIYDEVGVIETLTERRLPAKNGQQSLSVLFSNIPTTTYTL